jgi:sporulation protein YlmC with PRC-barrel domain
MHHKERKKPNLPKTHQNQKTYNLIAGFPLEEGSTDMFAKDELFNKEVVGKSGTIIGKVKDVIIDPNDWRVIALQIELESQVAEFLHMKKRIGSVHHPINVTYVQAVGDRVVLKADMADLPALMAAPGAK